MSKYFYSLQGWLGGLEKAKKSLHNIKMAPNMHVKHVFKANSCQSHRTSFA